MTIVATIRTRSIARELSSYSDATEKIADVDAQQLALFNEGWRASLYRSPVARELKSRLKAPDEFSEWREINDLVPFTSKDFLRDVIERVASSPLERVTWRSTGGSSGSPFCFPTSPSEAEVSGLDIWLGRRWLGVSPSDRLFLIWGHAHTLGSGWRGVWARVKREASDRALGYTRFSAYQMDDAALRRGGEMLLASRARYVLGYSVGLDRFCRANWGRAKEFRALKLVAAIATAEGFPHADSRDVIEKCLGCRVSMEYGSMETGPLAYEIEDDRFKVFWRHHRLDVEPPGINDRGELLVTCLYPRALPLIRYKIGDLVAPEEDKDVHISFKKVVGRVNDAVALPDGAVIHSEAFTHSVRGCKAIKAYQVLVAAGSSPMLLFQSSAELSADEIRRIRISLGKVHPALENIEFERREQLEQSPAGKHRFVVNSK